MKSCWPQARLTPGAENTGARKKVIAGVGCTTDAWNAREAPCAFSRPLGVYIYIVCERVNVIMYRTTSRIRVFVLYFVACMDHTEASCHLNA